MKFTGITIAAMALFFSVQHLQAQTKYITHTIAKGETLSALASQYHTSVGDIMRLNGMNAGSVLNLGDKIKIPSNGKAVAAAKPAPAQAAPAVATPFSGELTHIVAKGETLFSISKKYGVTVNQLKTWNHLTDDGAKLGTLLIVNEHGNTKMTAAKTTTPPATQQPVASNSDFQPVPDDNTTTSAATKPVVEDKPVINNEPAKTENVYQPAAAPPPVNNTAATDVAGYTGEGYFATQYSKKNSGKDVAGVSKVFKTASGWADGKYYILANDIEPGTIVKLTADNGNSVYAKVLWNMGDLKDNDGVNFRVSNATAAALRENEASFNLHVSF